MNDGTLNAYITELEAERQHLRDRLAAEIWARRSLWRHYMKAIDDNAKMMQALWAAQPQQSTLQPPTRVGLMDGIASTGESECEVSVEDEEAMMKWAGA